MDFIYSKEEAEEKQKKDNKSSKILKVFLIISGVVWAVSMLIFLILFFYSFFHLRGSMSFGFLSSSCFVSFVVAFFAQIVFFVLYAMYKKRKKL